MQAFRWVGAFASSFIESDFDTFDVFVWQPALALASERA